MGDTLGAGAFWIAMAVISAALFLGPVGQALGRRLSGGKPDPSAGITTGEMNAERVAGMEERILELEAERHLLEERVEFAERLLLQTRAEPRGPDQRGDAA